MDTSALGFDTATPLGPALDGSPRSRYRRRRSDKLIAGVAGGLADHLRVNPLYVRIAFALLSGVGGFGVVLYGAFWVLIPQTGAPGAGQSPGLASATRRGFRLPGRETRPESMGQLVALLAVGVGAIWFLQQTGFGVDRVVLWPAIVVALGLAVVWWQADQAELRAAAGEQVPGSRRALEIVRWVAGVVLVAIGIGTFVVLADGPKAAGRGVLIGAAILVGIALIVGPWLLRLWRTLADERAERLRSQTHADLAAHLHDSVLQTLALIQRQAQDPREVARLARGQERDLRAFLYGDAAMTPGSTAEVSTLGAALRRVAAEVEDQHGVAVEVVTVGDAPLDGPAGEARRALLAAAREAMVNAAVHAGTTVDVYAEVDDDAITTYVRDRGPGFDPAEVPEDRAGVRHSIIGRMQRHGGRAAVRSRPGQGTEIELRLDQS